MSSRKPIVGGNWKCNPASIKAIDALVSEWAGSEYDLSKVDVVIGATHLHLQYLQKLANDRFKVSAQNCSKYGEGAYTGEVTASQLVDAGFEWVIVGHSERRHKFGESNEDQALKLEKAQEAGLNCMFCVGELLEERQAGSTLDVCLSQLEPCFDKVKNWSKVVIAYEPVWAIGTGVVASVEQAQEACAGVRKIIADKVGEEVASAIRIQYGGSVTPDNCGELIACPDVDGFFSWWCFFKRKFHYHYSSIRSIKINSQSKSLNDKVYYIL